ncbi:glycoside hydrolase family 3 protein [Bacillus sp. JCM 19034]|uniref:glycoside hydrolase family 3 protein n=1 Tax=Bacillus sp. JCM 19034 TaxID=1481928 RepID=UPI000AFB0F92|nr:glycoside hydrolase family 3 protein [Bacillus sp. JCM 19034]
MVALFALMIVTVVIASMLLSVPQLVQSFMIGVIIVGVLIFILGLIWSKKNKTEKKGKRVVLISLLSLGIIALIGINIAIYHYQVVIDQYLTKVEVDQDELAEIESDSRDLTEKIQEEGIVLLENKNNTLPLNTEIENEMNISVFGQRSVGIVYGGSGSGAGDESRNVNLKQGLENAGFNVYGELTEFYESFAPEKDDQNNFELHGGDFTLMEPELSEFSEELLAGAEEFSDVALIVLAREGGEGDDLPFETEEHGGSEDRHYLQLTEAEEEMIDMVTSMDFEKVVVLVNSSNAMELGFLEDDAIDAALWIGGPGSTGLNAVGSVLAGDVNPSGRLVNVYAYDLSTAPGFYNAGDFRFLNSEHVTVDKFGESSDKYHAFLNYAEGIYVGYRFYETRFVDNETGEIDEDAYESVVQYPFGYGLSYSDFTQEITNYNATSEMITVEVEVTNTGDVAGKEVVQVYYTSPYYEGGIEKSHVVLGAFDKTDMLEPGASETVTLEIPVEEMASYDYQNEQAYVLDEGTYEIKLMNNSHDVIDSRDFELTETIVFNEGNERSTDEMVATNVFDDALGDITYVSRADWEGTLPTERTPEMDASEEMLDILNSHLVIDNDGDEDIVFADHGLTLEDVRGLDYDDPLWSDLLEQLSINDMARLIGFGGYATQEVESVGKPATIELDGPAGINSIFTGLQGVQFVSQVVIASTWNVDLAEQMGEQFAAEATIHGVSGLYAPGVNIHRTPFSGRNFEYYSEDGFLSGKMGAAFVQGSESNGVYTFVKHYALNDQEKNRDGVVVWTNEQAIREIYLKPFELTVKEGGATAMMSSFNRIGTTWLVATMAY